MKEKIRYMMIANVTCFLLLPINSAFAYLDPGTGSMMVQALIAIFAVVSVSIGIFWRRLRSFFSRLFGRKNNRKENDTNNS